MIEPIGRFKGYAGFAEAAYAMHKASVIVSGFCDGIEAIEIYAHAVRSLHAIFENVRGAQFADYLLCPMLCLGVLTALLVSDCLG